MIGLDTNVLVRYIVQDDPAQAERAGALIENNCTTDDPGRIDAVVLCVLVWVLEGPYGYGRDTVARVLRQILSTAEFTVDTPHLSWSALRAYERDGADFADYLIGARNKEAGCTATYTFDKRAAKSEWHRAVE